ncbi:MAG: polysaccharide biosynthesis protein [Gaiellaceae bacterium]
MGDHIWNFGGKTILVTGGTGTVGSAIVERLLETDAEGIRIYSRDEHKQFELRHRLPADPRLRFLIGDTRDLHRLRRALDGVEMIFHTAAMKHVHSCEYNPFEAVQTNIVGTQNVVDAAIDAGVERVMFASSDKAVNPTSTMGVSKLMAEKLISAADAFRGTHPTIFTSARFGNVVGSRGSVIPLFAEQIAAGGPITLTDRRMTRFVMSIEHAVELMFDALALAKGGEVFVLKMPALRIEDLAVTMRDALAPLSGYKPEDVDIQEVGMRGGEKLSEELLTAEELTRCLETDDLFIVLPQVRSLHPDRDPYTYPQAHEPGHAIGSDLVEPMTEGELRELLVDCRLVGAA